VIPVEPNRRRQGAGEAPPDSDVTLLVELAGLDEVLGERGRVWHELVRYLDRLRRGIAVASAQAQRSRSLAALKASREQDGGLADRTPAPARDDAGDAQLLREFEAALRETEQRRVALHAEMEALRGRRQDLLGRLSAPISRAYQPLADGGRTPAVATVVNGACGGCQAPLPQFVVEALGQGAVVSCARCQRLLLPAGGGD
jgi:hypothetical protein